MQLYATMQDRNEESGIGNPNQIYQIFKKSFLSSRWLIEPLACWFVGLSSRWLADLSSYRPIGLLVRSLTGPLTC